MRMSSVPSIIHNIGEYSKGSTAVVKGIISRVPGLRLFTSRLHKGTGGTISARYCYSVWLRHLVKAKENRLPIRYKRIAELGPGEL